MLLIIYIIDIDNTEYLFMFLAHNLCLDLDKDFAL